MLHDHITPSVCPGSVSLFSPCLVVSSIEVFNLWDVFILSCTCSFVLFLELFCYFLEVVQVVWSKLWDNTWEQVLQLLVRRVSANDVGVGSNRGLHLWVGEVDHVIFLEDIYFLNAWNSVHAKSSQSVLKSLVVGASGLVDGLLLSPNGSLSADTDVPGHLPELFDVHLKQVNHTKQQERKKEGKKKKKYEEIQTE